MQPHKSRRGLYRLKDNFLRFWFRFILPNRSQLERGAKEIVFETVIRPEVDHFAAPIFEQACQQFFWRAGLKDTLPFTPQQIGGWWQANQEVDLVVLGETQIMLVECKWGNRPVGLDILENLEAKTSAVQKEASKQYVLYGLCSRSGFTEQLTAHIQSRDDVYLYDWQEISALGKF
jgi:AAA+ ATPase superfamily predicted ATPase